MIVKKIDDTNYEIYSNDTIEGVNYLKLEKVINVDMTKNEIESLQRQISLEQSRIDELQAYLGLTNNEG